MTFNEWLESAGLHRKAFAELAGLNPASSYRWAQGSISAEGVAIIQAITNGRVTALDFYPEHAVLKDMPEAKRARARVNATERSKLDGPIRGNEGAGERRHLSVAREKDGGVWPHPD